MSARMVYPEERLHCVRLFILPRGPPAKHTPGLASNTRPKESNNRPYLPFGHVTDAVCPSFALPQKLSARDAQRAKQMHGG